MTSKKEHLNIIEEMIKTYDNLPQNAMIQPVNHYDFCSLLILIASFLREDCKEDKSDIKES